MIINIVINIKKGSGGNNATLLGDFALEPSENFNLIFSELTFADFIDFKWVCVAQCFLLLFFYSFIHIILKVF